MGFGADVRPAHDGDLGELLGQVQPEELVRFGLIPEFVGRFPVLAALSELDAPDLVRILTEPRNALFKQYQTMFALEGVDLIFTDQAVQAVARRAVSLRTGARALRAIMEDVMLDLMYEVPANAQIRTVTITEDVIEGRSAPEILTG